MENTDKADIEREIISTELLNENSMLVISRSEDEKYPIVSLRYEEMIKFIKRHLQD